MLYYGLEWESCDTYMQFKEVTAPGTPQANEIRQYAKDSGGISTMCWKNDAGVETCLPTGGGSVVTGSGVANRLAFWTSASNLDDVPRTFTPGSVLFAHSDFLPQEDNSNLFWDDSNNLLTIGVAGGIHGSTSNTRLNLERDGADCTLEISAHGDARQGGLSFNASRGTHASPTVVVSGDDAGIIQARAFDGNSYEALAFIRFFIDETPGDGDMPGRISIWTTPNGSATPAERLRINNAGAWGLSGATFGSSGNLLRSNGAAAAVTWQDHTLDFLTQYALLAGRAGGQTLIGGTAASEELLLRATSHATAGTIASLTPTAVNPTWRVRQYADSARHRLQRANGTVGSETAILTTEEIGAFQYAGHDGSAFTTARASFSVTATENWNSTNNGCRLNLAVTNNGATVVTTRVIVPEDGGIAIEDGITAPATLAGFAKIYVDTADGDLKVKFGDGTVKTIATDT